ncbi:malonyl CoA-acyl carrier protein transacylase [Hyphomonas neptunium ATCC 15444]|uniref:Malonyl CoA-acyl carrier protein transacylase n=2 Tax=Hyphomonas TaxID=85 RepID=Q0C086_HYPNA|nr:MULTISPECIES: ACP S-malonyltransferase [Hyphomonas]ABI77712.1 malonyl CoA-acyl carrier protein transacylase [Hyphomonas neptunium ATCC 15444]KCZ90562.1 malonyl CoA-acyl carrier protein transacylase [Hyphomonas hirschiana VP5]
MTLAFIFPGQGSQEIGMGKALADAFPAAKAVFEEVDAALSQKLSSVMWEGDIAELTLTANTQPALMAHSVAAMRALEAHFGISAKDAAFVAGHSLGEYSALASAGSISVSDTARLLRIRGNAMQSAVQPGQGAMAALLGADYAQAEAACAAGRETGGACDIANDNAPGQLVISGTKAAIDAAIVWSQANGVKKAMALNVSAPFHCALMQPAADAMAAALADTEIKAPAVPLVANVSASAVTDPETIRQNLVKQVTGRVRWTESVQYMVGQGVTMTGEAGAGKVLTVMQRRIEKSLNGFTLGTPEDLEAFAKAIKES